MRWDFIICLLIVSAAVAKPRPKRTLGHIKSFFANKLFGPNKVVIAQPLLANNETYQLFKIPGYNDIIIKVSKKESKPDKNEDKKKPDAVIVTPEVAIIGSYLGTETEKETQIAIEMVRNMINSGVLTGRREGTVQELVVPLIPEPPRLEYYENQHFRLKNEDKHMYVPMERQQVAATPFNTKYSYKQKTPGVDTTLKYYENQHFRLKNEDKQVYIPMEMQQVALTPLNTKYSYKQKTPGADTTFESYNNHDVTVTRTEKEPPIPQHIKLRIAELATTAANPYAVKPSIGINNPMPYYVNPGPMVPTYVQDSSHLTHRVPQPQRYGVPGYVGYNVNGGVIKPPPIMNHDLNSYYVSPGSINIQNPASYLTHGVTKFVGNVGDGGPVTAERKPTYTPEPINIGNSYHVANNMQASRCNGQSTLRICPPEYTQLKGNSWNIASVIPQTVSNNANDNESKNNKAVNELLNNHSVNGQLVSQYLYKQINHHSNDNFPKGQPQNNGVSGYAGYNINGGVIKPPPIMNHDLNSYYVNPGSINIQNPASYLTHGVTKFIGNVGNGGPVTVERKPTYTPEPINVGSSYHVASRCKGQSTLRICPPEYTQSNGNSWNIASVNPQTVNNANDNESKNSNAYNKAVNEFLNKHSVNGQLVSQYLYKQINHHSNQSFTKVNVETPPLRIENNKDIQDFVYMPPKEAEVHMLSLLGGNNQQNTGKVIDDKTSFNTNTPLKVNHEQYVPTLNLDHLNGNFKENPIVVSELNNENNETKENGDDTNKDVHQENTNRGDIPGSTF